MNNDPNFQNSYTKTTYNSGFTLLEVLLALLIFSIISVSIMTLISNVDTMRINNIKKIHATLLASNASEVVKFYENDSNSSINDSNYTVNIDNVEYAVNRVCIDSSVDSVSLNFIEFKISRNNEVVNSFKILSKLGIKNE